MKTQQLHDHSVAALRQLLRSGELDEITLIDHYLSRIAQLDTEIGSFATITADKARERATQPVQRNSGISGIPFADKDLVARAGVLTQYGSRAFIGHIPTSTDLLAKDLDELGGISLGKTTTSEFGMTGFTEPESSHPTRNPWNLTTGSGGSSGGAAAAVAAGLLPWAPGSDGGGSIRIPAATCGVLGMKPSRGRVRLGAERAQEALSVDGFICRSVQDAGFLLDAFTKTEQEAPFTHASKISAAGLRVGITFVTPWDDDIEIELSPHAKAAVLWAASALTDAAAELTSAVWEPSGYPELFRRLWRISASSLPLDGTNLDLVEPITRALFLEGNDLQPEHITRAYGEAKRFAADTRAAFSAFDAVLTPALAQTPRPLGWYHRTDPDLCFDQQVQYAPHTSWVNVCGLPAITIPVTQMSGGQPVSVQLVGRHNGEAELLTLAAALEDARGPLLHPPMWEE